MDFQGKIGTNGEYKVGASMDGFVEASVKIDILEWAQKAAEKTDTKLDDAFVATLKRLAGRKD